MVHFLRLNGLSSTPRVLQILANWIPAQLRAIVRVLALIGEMSLAPCYRVPSTR